MPADSKTKNYSQLLGYVAFIKLLFKIIKYIFNKF